MARQHDPGQGPGLEGVEETLEILSDPAEVAAIKQGGAEAARGEFVDVDDLR